MRLMLPGLLVLMWILSSACDNKKEKKESGAENAVPTSVPSFDANMNPNCKINNFSQTVSAKGVVARKENVTVTIDSTMGTTVLNGVLTTTSTAIERNRHDPFGAGGEDIAKALAKLGAVRTATLLRGKWDLFYAEKGFPNVKCAMVPITSLLEKAKDKNGIEKTTEVNFEPAIPYFISPAEGPALQTELASSVNITGVKATLVQAGDSELSTGTAYNGDVTINPENGAKFGATNAYRVKNNFGSAATTAALGLVPEAVYYVKDNRFIAVEVMINDVGLTTVVYK